MSATQDKFDLVQAFIKSGQNPNGKDLDNQQKLLMYALFKQIQTGPNKGAAPSKLKIVERAKYDAWKKLGQMSKEEAQKEYIKLIEKVWPTWNQYKPKL